MAVNGTMRSWDDEQGWGAIDSPETPGGCWAHNSHVAMAGLRTLSAGHRVQLEWPGIVQDGFAFRSVRVSPRVAGPTPQDQLPDLTCVCTLELVLDDA